MNSLQKLTTLAAACAAGISAAQALTIELNPTADTFVAHRSSHAAETTNFGTATVLDTLQFGTGIYTFIYIRFDLSSLGAGATINSATLSLTKTANVLQPGYPTSVRNDLITTGRFAAYGLLDTAGNTAQDWSETSLTHATIGTEKNADSNTQFNTLSAVTSFDEQGETITGGGTGVTVTGDDTSALVSFLQERMNAGAHTGLATFIVDFPTADGSARGYAFASREAATGFPVLTIDYTPAAVPEPSAFAAIAGLVGLGFAASRRRRVA